MPSNLAPSLQPIAEKIRTMLAGISVEDRAMVLADVERDDVARARIKEALAATGDCRAKAAKLLGVSRRTLGYRMQELGFPPAGPGRKRKVYTF